MAKLVSVVREEHCRFGRRQLPLRIDDNLIMIMQLNDACLTCDRTVMKGKDMDKFIAKYNLLSPEELSTALMVSNKELFHQLSVSVPCVGCRRSVERLFVDLVDSGYPALEPLVVNADAVVALTPEYQRQAKALATLFHIHAPKLNSIIRALPKSKKNQRCVLHSLDIQRSRPLSNWAEVWDTMSRECREAVVLIEADMLLDTLEAYLRKHRFCVECRAKVLRAYNILVGDADPSKEKGYLPSLYEGIRICPPPDKHIHIQGSTEFIDGLITRAEPELMGNHSEFSRRERHAKTIEIAQEEVLTCLGICLYERLHKIQQRSCEEELTWELLFCLAVEALQRNFELAIEDKQGVSQLELICEEIKREEMEKQQRKEQKRLKKKQRKQKEKKNGAGQANEGDTGDECTVAKPDQETETEKVTTTKKKAEESRKKKGKCDLSMTTVTTTVIRRRSDGCIDAGDPRSCVVVPGFEFEEPQGPADDSDRFEEVRSTKKTRNASTNTNLNPNSSPASSTDSAGKTNKKPDHGVEEACASGTGEGQAQGQGKRRKKKKNAGKKQRQEQQLLKEGETPERGESSPVTKLLSKPNTKKEAGEEREEKKKKGDRGRDQDQGLPTKTETPRPSTSPSPTPVSRKDDCGYCSSCTSTASNDTGSSEGSDICSEGFCNHESFCGAQCETSSSLSTSSHEVDEPASPGRGRGLGLGLGHGPTKASLFDCGMRTCESPGPEADPHHHQHPAPGYMTLLEQMLEDDESDAEGGESLISQDEIERFETQLGGKIEEKRAKLREDLKERFARLCNFGGAGGGGSGSGGAGGGGPGDAHPRNSSA